VERINATAWLGPPGDILGYPVPIARFVARTNRAVIALQHAIAFTEGCSFTLHLAVRRGSLDESAWNGAAPWARGRIAPGFTS
jgi:hypothetical protein